MDLSRHLRQGAGSDENYNLSVTATLKKIVIFRGGTNTNTQITIIQDIKWWMPREKQSQRGSNHCQWEELDISAYKCP